MQKALKVVGIILLCLAVLYLIMKDEPKTVDKQIEELLSKNEMSDSFEEYVRNNYRISDIYDFHEIVEEAERIGAIEYYVEWNQDEFSYLYE